MSKVDQSYLRIHEVPPLQLPKSLIILYVVYRCILCLLQEKEQVKNKLISKEQERQFVEYLGKDPEKWPSSSDVGQ